jgi:Leucine-rich repeat (LRR) protein
MLFRIDSALFAPAKKLTRLGLSSNDELRNFKLKSSHLRQLVEFSMFQVKTLDNMLFAGLERIQILRISDCKVDLVFSNAFLNINHLSLLYLQKNRIKALNLSVSRCSSLELLDISNNQIETLNQFEFQRTYKLNRLVMAGNRIKVFSPKDNPFSRYTLLDISNTTSQLISSLHFSLLERLLTIDLSQNDLNERLLDLSKMSSMKRLHLRNTFQNLTIKYDLA